MKGDWRILKRSTLGFIPWAEADEVGLRHERSCMLAQD